MYPNKTGSTGEDVLKIYKEATYDIDELILECQITTTNDVHNLHPTNEDLNSDGKYWSWSVVAYHFYGLCYTLEIGPKIEAQKVKIIAMKTRIPFYLKIHHKGN